MCSINCLPLLYLQAISALNVVFYFCKDAFILERVVSIRLLNINSEKIPCNFGVITSVHRGWHDDVQDLLNTGITTLQLLICLELLSP